LQRKKVEAYLEAERLGFEVPSFVRREIRESHGYVSHVPEVRAKAMTVIDELYATAKVICHVNKRS
jgi:hypothetical protein